jgi:antitoxin ParD1/3/4
MPAIHLRTTETALRVPAAGINLASKGGAPMADRHQLSVTLPDDLADQVRTKVASGRYASESEVVIEALRTLEDRERTIEQWLRSEVVQAYDTLEADPAGGVSLDEVRASLAETRRRLEAAARPRALAPFA